MARATPRAKNVGEAFRPPATELPPWLPVRRRSRLDLEVYREPGQFFVSITTEGGRPWFRCPEVVHRCAEELRRACIAQSFALEAYCFMPDHLHVLVLSEAASDLVRFVHQFKQRTGWWLRNRYVAGGLKASPTSSSQRAGLWQKSYYDHILRREEDARDVVRYILENPVRAGLVASPGEYPHAWSKYGALEAV